MWRWVRHSGRQPALLEVVLLLEDKRGDEVLPRLERHLNINCSTIGIWHAIVADHSYRELSRGLVPQKLNDHVASELGPAVQLQTERSQHAGDRDIMSAPDHKAQTRAPLHSGHNLLMHLREQQAKAQTLQFLRAVATECSFNESV